MPYFIICPIYALLFVGLLLVSAVLFFIKSTRSWSSYIACGAAGTIPGFILGNILFWLVAWGLVDLMLKPIHQILSDIMNGAAAPVVILLFVGGLAVANIGGCVAGFFAGVWVRSKFRRKSAIAPTVCETHD
jgi:ABC-type antimicrobial peptide transport system permease subunit